MSLYALLEVPRNASTGEIHKGFRRAALRHHPDRTDGQEHEQFLSVKEAYETLKNNESRHAYDRQLERSAQVYGLRARLQERTEGDVMVVTWEAEVRSGFLLRMQQEGAAQHDWKPVYTGPKRKVAVRHLQPGRYVFSCCCQGGDAVHTDWISVPDRKEEAIAELIARSGLPRDVCEKALHQHDFVVQAVLDTLIKTGKPLKERRKKKKKKKKKVRKKRAGKPEEALPHDDETLDELARLIKCSRCKVVVTLDEVEMHECDESRLMNIRLAEQERTAMKE